MRIFTTLALLIVAAIGLWWYAEQMKSTPGQPVLSEEDKALVAPLISPSALPSASPSAGVSPAGGGKWGHRPGLDTAQHGPGTRRTRQGEQMEQAQEAARQIQQSRKEADDAGAF